MEGAGGQRGGDTIEPEMGAVAGEDEVGGAHGQVADVGPGLGLGLCVFLLRLGGNGAPASSIFVAFVELGRVIVSV